MLKETNIPYVAGLFDGEGCVYIYERKAVGGMVNPSFAMAVTVSSTNSDILYWLKGLFGGSINFHKRVKLIHRTCGEWRICSLQALPLLKSIQPYVRIKKEQVNLAILFQEMQRRGGGRRRTSPVNIELNREIKIRLQRMKRDG